MPRPLLAAIAAVCFSAAACSAPVSEGRSDVAGPLSNAALLAASCSGCHAVGGRAIVSLEGYDQAALLSSLTAYKTDDAGTSVMHRIARGYSEAELAEIAAYLGGAAEAAE